ncbi:5-formyltetrahydrofolate cyclo-ligase [Deinococcus xianganensis]|uniref:5-formyltetrahydrofolate cyclo-ligase n=1 Tax=Deinococcus xianganensis TaxID=1507289 RepID=A0A6I4YE26_9DEIO|nr:5-formyltetrahydrofolate cyclo-ligase [Deinococcus xianganensis]MXV18201.1 5-formyltetrahydrofolate cyclo-ligase [Deinococcus xianganensis]
MTTAGAVREQVWDDLMGRQACAYPLPPHGHCPNFTHAKKAAAQLLAHPDLTGQHTLIVGPERALLPLRQQALKAGKTLYVPHQKKDGWYWRVTDPRGARLSTLPAYGEPTLTPAGAQAAVLACVAVDTRGARLGKGFGWGARGLPLNLPEYTLAHPLMLREALPCPADSHVTLIGLPDRVLTCPP